MNKTKYKLRHVACNMEDFHMDRHRFRFEYNGKEYLAFCYFALHIEFEDNAERDVPETVLCELQPIIWSKIDNEEKKWRYPNDAYDIADAYVNDEF